MNRAGATDAEKPATIDQAVADDFAKWGAIIPKEQIVEDPGFEILRDNWTSFTTFLACETQWTVLSTFGGLVWMGLDYLKVEAVLRLRKISEEVFDDLQIMEQAALAGFAEVKR